LKQLLDKLRSKPKFEKLIEESRHWNGYQRETAVLELGSLGDPTAIPALIVRVNDWVPQIREAARKAILRLATTQNLAMFVDYLPELFHLKTCERDDHKQFIESICDYVSSSETSVQALISATQSLKPKLARISISILIERQLVSPEEAFKLGSSHQDIVVRLRTSRLLRDMKGKAQQEALKQALNDKFMPIRREALQFLYKQYFDVELAKRFLLDRHPSIREIAVKYLKDSGVDVSIIYRELMTATGATSLKLGIWGVSYLADKESIERVRSMLENKFPSVRRQAVNALTKLTLNETKELLQSALLDSSPGVRKEASRLIHKHKVPFNAEELLAIFDRLVNPDFVKTCVGIASSMNKWETLMFLLGLLDEKRACIVETESLITEEISKWDQKFNQSYVQPTKEQIGLLKVLCKKHQSLLSLGLRFTLKTFGIVVEEV
jgi:hypothetical protein